MIQEDRDVEFMTRQELKAEVFRLRRLLRVMQPQLQTVEKEQKVEMAFEYCPGDIVQTSAIAGDSDDGSTEAKVRTVYEHALEVIYGLYRDRAIVAKHTCTFVRKGTLDILDLERHAPTFG